MLRGLPALGSCSACCRASSAMARWTWIVSVWLLSSLQRLSWSRELLGWMAKNCAAATAAPTLAPRVLDQGPRTGCSSSSETSVVETTESICWRRTGDVIDESSSADRQELKGAPSRAHETVQRVSRSARAS
eukprot:scaffold118560_cov60-Phaeocystis_antarctica.AAC.3